MGFTKWLGKRKAKQPLLHHREHQGKLYRSHVASTPGDWKADQVQE